MKDMNMTPQNHADRISAAISELVNAFRDAAPTAEQIFAGEALAHFDVMSDDAINLHGKLVRFQRRHGSQNGITVQSGNT